jgi:hypothetical protein
MKDQWFFGSEFARLQDEFSRADYSAFLQVLHLCFENKVPLPEWAAAVVIQQAEDVFRQSSRGRGKHGNWRASYNAKQINNRRAELAAFHLQARRRQGRVYVSDLGRLYGYGVNKPAGSSFNIVSREDVFEFISKELRGTPAQGTARAIKDSYERVKRAKRGAE